MIRRGSMVRIHPDPPVSPTAGAGQRQLGRARGCSSVGRAPALQAGGRRFDPVQLHHGQGRPGSTIDCGFEQSSTLGIGRQWPALNAVRSLTIGKARRIRGCRAADARVELYLARDDATKGVVAGGANTLVAVVPFARRVHGYGVKRLSACDGCLGDYRR